MLLYGKKTFYVEDHPAAEQSYDYHFALITEEVGNAYWRLIENGAKEAAENENVYLEYIGPSKSDLEEKLQTLDRMISAKVDGIITQGLPGQRFLDLVHKARENGIPVITVDTDVPKSERQVYVGTNNYEAGFLAGQALIVDTKGEQNVGVIMGSFEALNQQERLDGFLDAISNSSRIKVVDQKESNITEIGAAQATYSILREHPEITALFGTSALDGVGIVQGIREFNPSEDMYVAAFDILPETLSLIEDEDIDITISQYPKEMGKVAVEQMLKIQQEESVNPFQYTATKVIRKDDVRNGELIGNGDAR
ncbi:sugar ABC transporter substrate-binding protein [Radiobacillus deserti]|uniref:Sugar ABC transporter substrate-binding protein n=2 Tax=Radiobacillus deserti TaxID=2594883 RepID=A0A516KLE1_9BACI|nr:sugar ABC transporter substrate-binding protein [Radiobacillus deserti]